MQSTSEVFMVRPVAFECNVETMADNKFQSELKVGSAESEFDLYVTRLREYGVNVNVVQDTVEPHTPDSIFPNNWFTFSNGTLILYPMANLSRQRERKHLDKLTDILKPASVIDLTTFESSGLALEGTGCLLRDHLNNTSYIALSQRAHPKVIEEYQRITGEQVVTFRSCDPSGAPIYHTNVIMAIGTHWAVFCSETVGDETERANVLASLRATGRAVVEISMAQVFEFCGNVMELRGKCPSTGEERLLVVMSSRAKRGFTKEQLAQLTAKGEIVVDADLNFIEVNGGGSARCMVAEIFRK